MKCYYKTAQSSD